MLASISFIDNSLKDECSIKELIACLNSLEVMGEIRVFYGDRHFGLSSRCTCAFLQKAQDILYRQWQAVRYWVNLQDSLQSLT